MTHERETLLVTGGAGFIGTHLCRRLASQSHRVRVLDLRAPETAVPSVEYVRGDVRDAALLEKCMAGVTTVYHLAATVSVPLCQKDPIESYSNNFTATVVVLEAIRRRAAAGHPSPRLVFASTAALYGTNGDDGRALREEDAAIEFLSFYAAQKDASERAISLYARTFGVPAAVFRFFNVYGPGQDPTSPYSGVITVFSRLAREGRDLPLNGGGAQTRDFISVHDLVDGLVAPLSGGKAAWDAEPMNLGSGTAITVRELASKIREALGGRFALVDAPPREGDVLHSRADIRRAREKLGFAPRRDLLTGLRELLETGR
jgi:UDP-glucose 4-epimerase